MLEVLEVDPQSLNMNVSEFYVLGLEANSAVVVVHNVGSVVNVPRLKKLRPDLIFVEDNCEAFMEKYYEYGKYTGTESLCAAVSFFANKTITSGEGGAFYTSDKDLYNFIYKTCHHGMSGERYVYDVVGRNYRMTNIQAAMLYDQLNDIDTIVKQKKDIYNRYVKLFERTSIKLASTGVWMVVIRIPGGNYDSFYKFMLSHSIDTRPMFYEIQKHKHLADFSSPNTIDQTDYAMIPSSPSLTLADQTFIAEKIKEYVGMLY
jgi:perosamine synthetase